MKRPSKPKGTPKLKKPVDQTGMIRVDNEVKAHIVKKARWGESINLTLRRMFGLSIPSEQDAKVAR